MKYSDALAYADEMLASRNALKAAVTEARLKLLEGNTLKAAAASPEAAIANALKAVSVVTLEGTLPGQVGQRKRTAVIGRPEEWLALLALTYKLFARDYPALARKARRHYDGGATWAAVYAPAKPATYVRREICSILVALATQAGLLRID